MQKAKLSLATLALLLALPALHGCVEAALLGTAAATGVMSAHDRRSTEIGRASCRERVSSPV